MSLPTNNKNTAAQGSKNQKTQAGSKFIKSASSSKQAPVTKKVRTGGANRGS